MAPTKEKRPLSNPALLFITDSEIDPQTKRPRSGWLPYLETEAKLLGIRVDTATLGETNEDMLKRAQYPLILLDTVYLSLDPKELGNAVGTVKKFAPSATIIVSTACPDWEYARAALLGGANNYVTQSINQQDLRAILKA